MPVIDVTSGLSGPIGLPGLPSLIGLRGLTGLRALTGFTGSLPWAPGFSLVVRIGVLAASLPLAAAGAVVADRRTRCRR